MCIAKAKANNMPERYHRPWYQEGSRRCECRQLRARYTMKDMDRSGIAIIVEALTDNKNRTAANVRSAFTKETEA